jgi:hypothetical protein
VGKTEIYINLIKQALMQVPSALPASGDCYYHTNRSEIEKDLWAYYGRLSLAVFR